MYAKYNIRILRVSMKFIKFILGAILLFTLISCSSSSNSTAERNIGLTVLSTIPQDLENNVQRENNIIVEFDAVVYEAALNEITIILRDRNNNPVEVDSVSVSDNRVILDPKINLYPNSLYRVTVSKDVMSVDGLVMKEDFVFSFTTRGSQWSGNESFHQGGGDSTVAMDNQGNAIVVTWDFNESNRHYELTRYEFRDGVWSLPVLISDIPGQPYNPAYDPVISMDNNGNAIIIWEQTVDAALIVTEYRNGAWSIPKVLGTLVRTSGGHSLAMNDVGNAIVVWETNDTIYKSELLNGNWSLPEEVSTGFSADNPKIAIDNNGNGVMLWSEGNNSSIYSSELIEGEWNLPKLVGVMNTIGFAQLAMDENGNAIAVWEQSIGSGLRQIYKNEFRDKRWIGSEAVSEDGVTVFDPNLAMSKNGNAIITWQQDYNSIWQIYRREYINGSWVMPSPVSPAGIMARNPYAQMDSYGGAILVWNEENGTSWQVMISQLANGEWSDNDFFTISDNTFNAVIFDISMNTSGEALFVWDQSDNSIWYQYRSHYK